MTEEEYALLRDLFGIKLGLTFSNDARASLSRRLRERLEMLSLRSFAEYLQYLGSHPLAAEEWEQAVELLTTHETYFYREDFQLRSFAGEVLPMLAQRARSRRRLSIWSAGCSTGEEVYTIAILVLESGLFSGWDVRVFGCDVSKRCVAAARRGIYQAASFRAIPASWRARYFEERPDGAHVSETVRALCHFGQMNLLETERAQLFGRLDAIFCRNVLIYLNQRARRAIIDGFHERLHPGGVLLLGHSESLLNVTTAFELLHLKEDLVYRKPQVRFRPPYTGP